MTPHELREVAAGYFLLPSPCLAPVVGSQIILLSTEHNPVTVDLYGDALMNVPAPGDAHWRVHHDAIADAFRDHCVHDLGIAVRREVDDLFQQAVPLGNTVPRDELKDLVPDAELSLPAFNVVTGSYDPRSLKSTLLEFKTMRYGVKYTAVPRATAVDRFERSLLGNIQRRLAARDAAWLNTEPGQKGPLRDILDMSEYTSMVFGTVAHNLSRPTRLHAGNRYNPAPYVMGRLIGNAAEVHQARTALSRAIRLLSISAPEPELAAIFLQRTIRHRRRLRRLMRPVSRAWPSHLNRLNIDLAVERVDEALFQDTYRCRPEVFDQLLEHLKIPDERQALRTAWGRSFA
eukprot:jgi/Tetstr1/461678/TSEL_006778.t1